jgi:rare lipoprotein A
MHLLLLLVTLFILSGCTFGVPMGNGPGGSSGTDNIELDSSGKSKHGNPNSYVVFGKRYFVMKSARGFVQRGTASWYGPDFHGKRTSSGETYNMNAMTAAHKTLPLPTMVRVENLSNGKTAIVKVNDRGPFVNDRIIDLSQAAAKKLGVIGPGTAQVEITALTSTDIKTAASEPRPPVRAIPLQSAVAENNGEEIYLQLGSFGSEANAISMRNQLNSQNEQAILISSFNTDSGTFYRVRLGPLLDIYEAESVQKRLLRKGYRNVRIVVGENQ